MELRLKMLWMVVRIALAGDHAILRQGLKRLLDGDPEMQVVAEAESAAEAVDLARQLRPDVAIVAVTLKGAGGFQAAAGIRRESPDTAILMVGIENNERYRARAKKAGAQEYLAVDSAAEELVSTVHRLKYSRHCIG